MKNKILGNKLFKSGKVLIAVAGVSVIMTSAVIPISTASANTNKVTPVHTASNWRANDQKTVDNNMRSQGIDSITSLNKNTTAAYLQKPTNVYRRSNSNNSTANTEQKQVVAVNHDYSVTANNNVTDKAAAKKAAADKAAADKAAADKAAADKAAADKAAADKAAADKAAADKAAADKAAADQAAADKAAADKAAADKAAADKAAADKAAADKAAADKAAADKAAADKAAADKAAADKAAADKAAADKAAADKAAADKAATAPAQAGSTAPAQTGAMVTIRGAIENGKFNIYDMRTNKLIKSLDAGTWENLAYSMDANSINNVDGYLSYSGWYRPIGTSQDGKTWYKTGAGDWRPILMYARPNNDVQAQFIKYFVGHGYTNEGYGLTPAKVADLSAGTDTKILNEDSQNLRYVIEQSIAKNKSTSKLANDVNAFMQTVPSLSAASELSVTNSSSYVPDRAGTTSNDQLILVNNNSADQTKGNTSYADSNYRLMNRTLNNQQGNHSVSPELLVGNDIDNSNPVVQAENLNWEYFLLNYGKLMNYNPDGNFDGFRVDAADNVDADALDQLGQLMNDLYHTKGNQTNANNHLVYNEGYHSDGQSLMDGKGNPELYMDSLMFYTLENILGRISHRDDITHLATNSVVNRANDDGSKSQTPNWSFVTNHDQRKNLINRMIINDHPGVKDIMGAGYKAEYANQAWQEFYVDQARAYKQYAQYNVPAQYAILLSNKDTVPQVYYGDLYNETKPYMAEKSMYYDAITTLMKARKEFVSGGQSIERCGQNAVASVRYGKGVADANSIGTDPLSRTTGMAVIVGNNTDMASNTYIINMGKEHANQQYQNLLDTTDAGLTYDGTGSLNPKTLTTDANGNLYVKVKAFATPYVSGYLSVWVPVVAGQQDASTSSSTVASRPDKTFESNAALDSHLIYEDFSLYQPEPTSVNEHAYNVIAKNAQLFNSLGITDFWMAPAYTPLVSRYNEGYATNDRYTLGTTKNSTKYGSGEELANAIAALHKAGLKVQEDLVMNQMIGLSGQETVTVTRANEYGVQMSVDGKTFANQIYFAYTIGGGEGQKKYGGKYLAELQAKYPDLFTTKALSTGVAPDPTTRITQWSAKYQNGTSLQNIGIGLAVKLPNGDYAYLDGGNNDKFKTTLPEQMGSIDYYVQADKAAADKAAAKKAAAKKAAAKKAAAKKAAAKKAAAKKAAAKKAAAKKAAAKKAAAKKAAAKKAAAKKAAAKKAAAKKAAAKKAAAKKAAAKKAAAKKAAAKKAAAKKAAAKKAAAKKAAAKKAAAKKVAAKKAAAKKAAAKKAAAKKAAAKKAAAKKAAAKKAAAKKAAAKKAAAKKAAAKKAAADKAAADKAAAEQAAADKAAADKAAADKAAADKAAADKAAADKAAADKAAADKAAADKAAASCRR
ncbi:glycoside hydrolase family 70 protein [Pediococcus damnosus]|nr:glycoside hydrolase family 70 protein [Pediococcus damnosus]